METARRSMRYHRVHERWERAMAYAAKEPIVMLMRVVAPAMIALFPMYLRSPWSSSAER
jgi:hypothetical protein